MNFPFQFIMKSAGCSEPNCLLDKVVHTKCQLKERKFTKHLLPPCPHCRLRNHSAEECYCRPCTTCSRPAKNHKDFLCDDECKIPFCAYCRTYGHHVSKCRVKAALHCSLCEKDGHSDAQCYSRLCNCGLPFHCHDEGCFNETCNKVRCTNCDKMGNHLAPECFKKKQAGAAVVQKKATPVVPAVVKKFLDGGDDEW